MEKNKDIEKIREKEAGVSKKVCKKVSKTEIKKLLNILSTDVFDKYFKDLSKSERNTLFGILLVRKRCSSVKEYPVYEHAMNFVRSKKVDEAPGYLKRTILVSMQGAKVHVHD